MGKHERWHIASTKPGRVEAVRITEDGALIKVRLRPTWGQVWVYRNGTLAYCRWFNR